MEAFGWFTGKNDLGLSLVNAETGSCCDGLHPGRVNKNRGAESVLSYLLGLVQMRCQGRHKLYRTNADAIRPLHEWTGTFERYWQHQLHRVKERAEARVGCREQPLAVGLREVRGQERQERLCGAVARGGGSIA